MKTYIETRIVQHGEKFYIQYFFKGRVDRQPALLCWHGEPVEFTTEEAAREYLKN